MEFKGTKGKWLFSMDNFGKVKKENGDLIYQTFYTNSENKDEQLPNAQLIAHAPDMLEMLSRVNDLLIRRTLPTESEVNQFAKDIQDLLKRATTI